MRRRVMWQAGVGLLLTVGAYGGSDLAAPGPGFTAPAKGEPRAESPDGDQRAGRRRWALAKMDEIAHERQRCRDRFKVPRLVSECEAQYARRYREYNEIYLDASRE